MDDVKSASKKSGGLEKNLESRISEEVEFEPHPRAVYDFSRHLCQVIQPTVKGSITKGTGFLVGPDLVLTCYHVIEDLPVAVSYTHLTLPTILLV